MIQRVALYGVLGLLLDALGHGVEDWGFWCVVVMYWALDLVSRQAGFEVGVVQGMAAYSQANEQQRADIDRIVKDNKNND
jgi:hypothetical protein